MTWIPQANNVSLPPSKQHHISNKVDKRNHRLVERSLMLARYIENIVIPSLPQLQQGRQHGQSVCLLKHNEIQDALRAYSSCSWHLALKSALSVVT
mmetsp:Transcript_26221/g.56337  ORF Transcript_26221/g.56337 Transcript_26221/m.56337 type:complete len:96 (-) Transcript_26221:102-389(-)